jgi:hypothetical protein
MLNINYMPISINFILHLSGYNVDSNLLTLDGATDPAVEFESWLDSVLFIFFVWFLPIYLDKFQDT